MQIRSSRIRLLTANLNIVIQWCAENISSPNTGCFFNSVTASEKIKKQFLMTLPSDLPRCRQSIDSLIYLYSMQIPSCFLWVLHHNRDHTSSYYRPPLPPPPPPPPPKKNKKILYYPLCIDTIASNTPQMKIKAVSQWTARFNLQRKPEKCWCLLRDLSFGLFDHKKIPGLSRTLQIPGISRTGGNHDISFHYSGIILQAKIFWKPRSYHIIN